jgi:ubiquinone/menaquinone biosynthesis C-methylase UbiE
MNGKRSSLVSVPAYGRHPSFGRNSTDEAARNSIMSVGDKAFTGSIPENYDRFLVPLIFQQYADDIASRIAPLAPHAILEIAAGSGVVTRALAPKLKATPRYTVTDLNQPMLDYAKSQLPHDARLTWRTADAQGLPFESSSFDVVICQFGAMFFPDRIRAYREARRVLKRDGRYIFNVWDRIEENVFADEVTNALEELFPKDPPRFLARTPHGYHDVDRIRSDVKAAGFTDIQIETKPEQSTASSARHAAMAYCEGTPLRNEIEARGGSLQEATEHARQAIARRHGEGQSSAKISAHVITAVS